MTVQSDALPVLSFSPTVHHGWAGMGQQTISAALREGPPYIVNIRQDGPPMFPLETPI